MIQETTGTFAGSDGLPLFFRRVPAEVPKGVLVFVHGLGEHSGRYQNPFTYFSARHYSLYALDLRGHGRSPGRRADATSWRQLSDDLQLFVRLVALESGRKAFLIGHSFGGQLVLNYLMAMSEPQIQGVILSSPNLRVAFPIPKWKRLAAKTLASFLPSLSLGNEVNPDHVSRDLTVVRAYQSDPLMVRRITTRLGQLILTNQEEIFSYASEIRLPVLLMHGGADRLTSPDASREFFEKIEVEDKTLKIYEGYYHEIFNEIGRETVFHDMETWLVAHQ